MSLLNSAIASGTVRRPRAQVTVNGTVLTGVVEIEVTNASHFTSDTYRVVAAVSGLPATLSPAYWALSSADEVTITTGFDDGAGNITYTPLIVGLVDDIHYDPALQTLTLSGRDLSAAFIDSKTNEKFQNLTSSQIATQLAQRHGLAAQVQSTSAKAGSFYNIDHVLLTQEQTEWDLLIFLARHEGFDVWVSGNTLFFQPSPADTAPAYQLICPGSVVQGSKPSNVTSLHLSRSETLAKDVIVIIRSWNQQQQKPFTVQYRVTKAFKSARTGGKAQEYSYTVPNLSRDQAQKLAQSTAEEITRHERVLEASLPGDNLLSTRARVQLVGSNTAWDQIYYPDTVTRRLSASSGYTMELRAKNHSPQSSVVLG